MLEGAKLYLNLFYLLVNGGQFRSLVVTIWIGFHLLCKQKTLPSFSSKWSKSYLHLKFVNAITVNGSIFLQMWATKHIGIVKF